MEGLTTSHAYLGRYVGRWEWWWWVWGVAGPHPTYMEVKRKTGRGVEGGDFSG